MNNFAFNFFLGLICTAFLLFISVVITLGVKSLSVIYFDLAKKSKTKTQPSPPQKKPKPQKTSSTVIRSIEIDPQQIDKIYVKKTG